MRSRQLRQTSVCQFSTCSWSLLEDIQRLQNYGFQSIGMWRRKLEDHGLESAIDLIFASKVNVTSLHWAGGFTGDGRRFDCAIEDTVDAIRVAAAINAGCLIIHPGSLNHHITKNANRLLHSALDHLMPIARDHNVQLVVEPILGHPHSPFTFHTTLNESLELLARYPELGINLDLYHVGMHEEAFERLPEYVDRIKLVQLADRSRESLINSVTRTNRHSSYRLPLGEGETNIHRWLVHLFGLGYRGPFEVELHGKGMPDPEHFLLMDQTYDYLQRSAAELRRPAKPSTQEKPSSQRMVNELS